MSGTPTTTYPRIVSLGTAHPPQGYSQGDILERFRIDDLKVREIFRNSHIQNRYLYLPPEKDGLPDESSGELIAKHLMGVLDMGRRAVEECLREADLSPEGLDQFVTVSSTGFLCPGISAHLIKSMGFRRDMRRMDIVGMGCNAGVNGLAPAVEYARLHPGRHALLLCCEVCSAAYVPDQDIGTGVVNSLFGDGSAAALLLASRDLDWRDGPAVLGFNSHIVPEAIDAMRFMQVDGKLSFFLDRDIPYLIGAEVRKPVHRLLKNFNLKKRNIAHWIIHSGGKKVIDSIKYNLGLSNHDLRHTRSILRNYGNLSSGSFLFSLQELIRENIVRQGDYGVIIAMGPGTSIETGLLRW